MVRRLVRSITSQLDAQVALRPFAALRESLAEGYSAERFRRDVASGLVVGLVALPLSMALAIASGVPPQHGLYTAIIAGGISALAGGSRVQVSGPTAAFVVILAPISAQFGLGGLLMASMLAGAMLMIMGVLRFGRLIQFIPYPVTVGFTAGIAVVIATLQLRDFLGLSIEAMPEHFLEKVHAIYQALPTIHGPDLAIGGLTLAVLVLWPRLGVRRIPAPLVGLAMGGVAGWVLSGWGEQSVATIATRFTWELGAMSGAGIPPMPPTPVLPWNLAGSDGLPLVMSWDLVRSILPSAAAIAMLGAIESLLSAVVADGMTGLQHDPDAELFGQGLGNMVAPFFGGIAATGAIARTAANVRNGGRSPMAAVVHAAFILLAVVALAPILGYLPMASLAALLLVVAWNMSEAKHFFRTLRIAPRSDVFVLVTCFGLTVVFDMVMAVGVGTVLAAMLFMKRMADVSNVRLVSARHDAPAHPLPPGVLVYEIAGPLFFGAAQKAMSELRTVGSGVKLVILDLRQVPVMDATGLVNLAGALDRLHKARIHVILAGMQKQPLQLLARSHLRRDRAGVQVVGDFEAALDLALWHSLEPSAPATAPEHAHAGPRD